MRLEYPKDRHEIIVVDNDSTDQTARIVDGYPGIRVDDRDAVCPARAMPPSGGPEAIIALIDADFVATVMTDPNCVRDLPGLTSGASAI